MVGLRICTEVVAKLQSCQYTYYLNPEHLNRTNISHHTLRSHNWHSLQLLLIMWIHVETTSCVDLRCPSSNDKFFCSIGLLKRPPSKEQLQNRHTKNYVETVRRCPLFVSCFFYLNAAEKLGCKIYLVLLKQYIDIISKRTG